MAGPRTAQPGGALGARHVEQAMGTVVSIDVRGPAAAAAPFAALVRHLQWVDATFSTYRPESAISRLGRGELSLADAPAEVRWVLGRCATLQAETGGYFDPRATGSLDPSALVKGWAVQTLAEQLLRAGCEDFCVNAGGDLVVRGTASGSPWRIGIQHPLEPRSLAAVIEAGDLAVATSGAYERGAHIVDPHLAVPSEGVLSATVCGPDLGTADAYSTAAFAMGPSGGEWALGLDGYEALTILADGTVLETPRFPNVVAR